MRQWGPILTLVLAGWGAGCVDRLPDQDLRIRAEVPVAKMSPDDLWKDFQADAAAARARYWGKAVEISGKPTKTEGQDSAGSYMLFVQSGEFGVRASLLDEDAPDLIARAAAGDRLTLKCYCEGLNGHVILKSCVKP